MQQTNRRESYRYPIKIPVNILINGEMMDGVSRNLSMGGMCLEIIGTQLFQNPIDYADDTAVLTFTPPEGSMEIIVEALICWNNGENTLGVRFNGLSPWAKTAMSDILNTYKERVARIRSKDSVRAEPMAT